jgi:hypothetical protein
LRLTGLLVIGWSVGWFGYGLVELSHRIETSWGRGVGMEFNVL